jgi:hypothetical protein
MFARVFYQGIFRASWKSSTPWGREEAWDPHIFSVWKIYRRRSLQFHKRRFGKIARV